MSTEEYPGVIAIDFGTTHIRVVALDNKALNFTIPSCVAFTENGILVGEDALEQRARDPTKTILGIKQYLGRHPEHPLVKRESPIKFLGKQDAVVMAIDYKGDRVEISPQGIASIILANVKQLVEDRLKLKIKQVAITIPASFNSAQRQALNYISRIGLEDPYFVHKPTAAAVAYGLNTHSKEKMVLALSIGGGAVEASLITIKNNNFFVNAATGDNFLGGVDFDDALVQYCKNDFKGRYNKDISGEWRALRRLRIACEEAKCTLSSLTETDIHVNDLYEGIDYSCRLTRKEFEEISKRIFIKIMGVVRALFSRPKLKALKYSKKDVDEVIAVGGSTNIPKIQSNIKMLFKKEIIFLDEGSVVYGTAVLAAHHTGTLEALDFSLKEVASSNCCIRNPNNSTDLLFRSKTCLPIKTSRLFMSTSDGSATNVSLFECDRNQNTYDYNLICNIALSDRELDGRSKYFDCRFEMKLGEGITITLNEEEYVTADDNIAKEIDYSFSGPGFLPIDYICPLPELLSTLQVKI